MQIEGRCAAVWVGAHKVGIHWNVCDIKKIHSKEQASAFWITSEWFGCLVALRLTRRMGLESRQWQSDARRQCSTANVMNHDQVIHLSFNCRLCRLTILHPNARVSLSKLSSGFRFLVIRVEASEPPAIKLYTLV